MMLGKDADHRGEGPAPACLCPPAAVRGQEAALRREAAQTGQLRRPPSRRVPPPPRDSCREDCRGRARWGGAHLWAGRGQQAWSPRGSLQEASPPAFTVASLSVKFTGVGSGCQAGQIKGRVVYRGIKGAGERTIRMTKALEQLENMGMFPRPAKATTSLLPKQAVRSKQA